MMRFGSGVSDEVSAKAAVEQACQHAAGQLGNVPCDLALVFVSPLYRASWPSLLAQVHAQLAPRHLIGCSSAGVIGGDRELEWVPAISVVAIHLPDVKVHPFLAGPDDVELNDAGGFWVDKIGASPATRPVFITLADAFTCNPGKLLEALSGTYRGSPVSGGLVSGGHQPGEHFLFLDRAVAHEGAVGVALAGNIAMDTIVSQGCRPIGRPYIITKAEEQMVQELGGQPAMEALHAALSTLSQDDRELAQQGAIFVGVVINEMRSKFRPGDFLIRSIAGVDPTSGAIAIGESVQVGQTLQFHLRDAATARDELRRLTARHSQAHEHLPSAGCLIFNCLGRGKSLYGCAHHDVKTIQVMSGKLPIGGFFCNGEIGPIGGTNFLHGYTASLGLFRPLHASAISRTTREDASRTV